MSYSDSEISKLVYNHPVTSTSRMCFAYSHGGLHKGIDYQMGAGTPIYAIAPGKVIATSYSGTSRSDLWGNYTVIDHGG